MRICSVASSLSLVIIGLVSLAPTSSVKRRPAKAKIHLSTNCKAKTDTFTTVQVKGQDGVLEQVLTWQVKEKASFGIKVRTLSHSYPNVLKYMINDILILIFSKVILTLLNHGWWKLNGIGLLNLTKSKSNAPLQRRRKTAPPIPAVPMDDA